MKKSLLCTLLLYVLVVNTILSGCNTIAENTKYVNHQTNTETTNVPDAFELVYKNNNERLFFYRETRTDVMYALFLGYGRYGASSSVAAMSIMLNTDGSPLLYSEWVEMEIS